MPLIQLAALVASHPHHAKWLHQIGINFRFTPAEGAWIIIVFFLIAVAAVLGLLRRS